jgi:hypothetical protein
LLTIGQALLEMLEVSVLGDVVIEATPEFADAIWKSWDARADNYQKCRDLQELATLDEEKLEDLADAVVEQLGLSPRDPTTESAYAYLSLIPATIRRYCRRPGNPLGTRLPLGLTLSRGSDLLPILPARMPRFKPGDRPWGIGDWELRQLLELEPHSEVWKAVNPRLPDRPPVSLRFFTSQAAKKHLKGATAGVLDRLVSLGRLPGVVPLQEIHLLADPPCVQYSYLQAADLSALVLEWRETDAIVHPRAITDLVYQIADTIGRLHSLQPPIMHGNLRGTNILLMTTADGRRRCLVADLGLGDWAGTLPAPVIPPPPNSASDSAERLSRVQLQLRNDVYALGVLWYQLLAGDLSLPRPGGSFWRRRLVARGMAQGLVELLESSFDDEADARPTDCRVLAEGIKKGLSPAR